MYENFPIRSGYIFSKIILNMFKNYNFEVMLSKNPMYDILAKMNDVNYLIEIKFFRTKYLTTSILLDIASRLKNLTESEENTSNLNIPVLIVNVPLLPDIRKKIEDFDVIIIDLQNLLFLLNENELLKSKLLSILDFSIIDLLPIKPNISIFDNQKKISINSSNVQGEHLKKCIYDWKASKGHIQYENLCFKTLNYLFNDELSLWKRQQTSNKSLYRFDLICKIKDGNTSGLWDTILQCFNSKYIIFEFKNYTKKITQKEIYTTDKYLYLKALRSVAIIISCNGASSNADRAIKGTLRENGKLILSISNQDLIKMIDIKINKENPSDYLYSKFDDLLRNLEK